VFLDVVSPRGKHLDPTRGHALFKEDCMINLEYYPFFDIHAYTFSQSIRKYEESESTMLITLLHKDKILQE
jgi:hypothetical protein